MGAPVLRLALVSENTVRTSKEGCTRPGAAQAAGLSTVRHSPAASCSSSVMGQVGRQLAIIGDAINQRYDEEFQTMLHRLQPTAENAYEYFTKIASR